MFSEYRIYEVIPKTPIIIMYLVYYDVINICVLKNYV